MPEIPAPTIRTSKSVVSFPLAMKIVVLSSPLRTVAQPTRGKPWKPWLSSHSCTTEVCCGTLPDVGIAELMAEIADRIEADLDEVIAETDQPITGTMPGRATHPTIA